MGVLKRHSRAGMCPYCAREPGGRQYVSPVVPYRVKVPPSGPDAGGGGAVLLGLVVIMMVLSALGAAMVPMTGTATFSPVWGNSSERAYLLAESGYRYAASQFRNEKNTDGDSAGSEDDRNQMLETLHTATPFTLLENGGTFDIKVFPYYFVTAVEYATPGGSANVQAKFPGAKPAGFTFSSPGRLKVRDYFYTYSGTSTSNGTVTFQNVQTDEATPKSGLQQHVWAYLTVHPVGIPASSATMSKDGNLTLANAGTFPLRNGTFTVEGSSSLYRYREKSGNTLTGITKAYDPGDSFSVSVDTATRVTLMPFIQLHSTGTFGQGETAVSREIVYHVPLEKVVGGKTVYHDPFDYDTLSNSPWQSVEGTHAIETIGGDKALRVTGTVYDDVLRTRSLIAFTVGPGTIDLARVHEDAGGFLSYDVQVKIGFAATGEAPVHGYDPESPIPKYFAAGISFRLDTSNNSYGVSFVRGNSYVTVPYWDEIPDNIIPPEPLPDPPDNDIHDKLLMVLWQRIGDTTIRWLAYQNLEDAGFSLGLTQNPLTLMIRLTEAASIAYTSGGTTPIVDGEVVVGQISNAQGIVNGTPIVDSGSWTSGNAQGTIFLSNVTGTFQNGEVLLVLGQDRANVNAVNGFRSKDNFIKVYYGDPGANGAANSTPLDQNREAIGAEVVRWPPDEVEDTAPLNDYFTLVQWDAYNTAVFSSNPILGSGMELNAILRTDHYVTPAAGSYTNTRELGLHTFGDGSENIYFDNFAIQTESRTGRPPTTAFVPPIQE